MGYDLYGKKAVSDKGDYFRNNVWWWRALSDYVLLVCALPERGWHENGGHEVKEKTALEIANTLDSLLANGAVARYSKQYALKLKALPDEECWLCKGTGKRTDMEVENGCNSCSGKGKTPHWQKNYPFSVENVREFSVFCRDSGGFTIC